jgi:hypothetical protein
MSKPLEAPRALAHLPEPRQACGHARTRVKHTDVSAFAIVTRVECIDCAHRWITVAA